MVDAWRSKGSSFNCPGAINILTAPARRQTFVASVRHPSLPRLRRESPESFWKLDGNGITGPLVHLKRCSRIDLKNVFYERPPRCRFEIALEPCSANSIRKRDICLHPPWPPFRDVKNSSCVM